MWAVVCALCVLATASCALAAASLTPLGFLPGDTNSSALAVNADGSVVVGWSGNDSGYQQAFLWTASSGMVGLGFLPSDTSSSAGSVSADGSVVVGYSGSRYQVDQQAFRWTTDSGMVGLGYLPGYTDSSARGISGDGSVVVGYSYSSSGTPSGSQAFRWTADSGMGELGFLPGDNSSAAFGVSADGAVIFGAAAGHLQAFRWIAGSGMVGLGYNTTAYGASADGSVIVGASECASDCQASRWTASSGMVGLGFLPGDTQSVAFGVNADGSVIVGESGSFIDSGGPKATFWPADSGPQRLWDALVSNGVNPAADGWTSLGGAYQITPDRKAIVGWGYRNGKEEAFLATIPASIGANPALSITFSPSATNQLVLSWGTSYIGFTPQWSSDLNSTNWTNCTSRVTTSSYYYFVTNPISAGAQFFRLNK